MSDCEGTSTWLRVTPSLKPRTPPSGSPSVCLGLRLMMYRCLIVTRLGRPIAKDPLLRVHAIVIVIKRPRKTASRL